MLKTQHSLHNSPNLLPFSAICAIPAYVTSRRNTPPLGFRINCNKTYIFHISKVCLFKCEFLSFKQMSIYGYT